MEWKGTRYMDVRIQFIAAHPSSFGMREIKKVWSPLAAREP